MWLLGFVCVFLYFVYKCIYTPYRYWTKRNIAQGHPLPVFGHNWGPFLRLCSFAEMIQDLYTTISPQLPYVGVYQFFTPILMLKDPELIKIITVKDFDHFIDHRPIVSADADPMWSKNLFALNGSRWRDLRTTLTSSFTTSKMKYMFGLIVEVAQHNIKHLVEKGDQLVDVEMKDICTRYGTDVIASAAFGINVDSVLEPQNEFYMNGMDATNFTSFSKNLKFFGFFLMPNICSLFKVKMFSTKVRSFFTRIVSDSIQQREQKQIIRPDMIQLLLEARKPSVIKNSESNNAAKRTSCKPIDDEDITAQALIFFFAGFDTASTTLCFTLYELALHPNIQQRLIEEIDEVKLNCGNKLTYEALHGMKFLDMVICESLRKWPPGTVLDRVCTKPYTLFPSDESTLPPVHFKRNDIIWIPVYAIHRDPQYYPNPDKFDPERFSDDNKHVIKPYTYLPFGSGPRSCIGLRFALMQAKTYLFHLLSEFSIEVNSRTDIPMKLSQSTFNFTARNGFNLTLKRRGATHD